MPTDCGIVKWVSVAINNDTLSHDFNAMINFAILSYKRN